MLLYSQARVILLHCPEAIVKQGWHKIMSNQRRHFLSPWCTIQARLQQWSRLFLKMLPAQTEYSEACCTSV